MSKSRYKLALVLGGGGARGLAHIGVIRKLGSMGIKPDIIVGTSMGAVIGGMYAQTLDIDLVEDSISKFIKKFGTQGKWLGFLSETKNKSSYKKINDFTHYIMMNFLKLKTLTSISLEEQQVLLEPLSEFLEDDNIENCKIKFAAVAIDLRNGRQVVFDTGSIIKAVYASAAVQGVFPPLEHNDMLLSDGGPIAIVPIATAKEMGAKKIIAVDVSMRIKPEGEMTSGLQVILRSDNIAQQRLKKYDLSYADIVLNPDIQNVHWANFNKLKYCVRRGENAVANKTDHIENLLKPKPWWRKLIG
jgi:NTE family protein